MSQTFTSPADWSDYFHSTTASVFNADSTTMATPTTHPNATSFSCFKSELGNSNNSINTRSNRVTKPARKRSRASRRTPTTMLSTDTSNFRAMVQQFTGGPSALPQAQLSSSLPFTIPSGYSFQFQQLQQQQGAYGGGGGGGEVEQARRMSADGWTPNVKSVDGGNINNFLY